MRDGNIAGEIAAERRHYAAALDGDAGCPIHRDQILLTGELLCGGAVLIADRKFLRRHQLNRAGIGEPVVADRALEAFLVEP